jgi:hypothetical protein
LVLGDVNQHRHNKTKEEIRRGTREVYGKRGAAQQRIYVYELKLE